MTAMRPEERYSVGHILNHPWITGRLNDEIPKTFTDIFDLNLKQKNINMILKTIYFLKYLNRVSEKCNIPIKLTK